MKKEYLLLDKAYFNQATVNDLTGSDLYQTILKIISDYKERNRISGYMSATINQLREFPEGLRYCYLFYSLNYRRGDIEGSLFDGLSLDVGQGYYEMAAEGFRLYEQDEMAEVVELIAEESGAIWEFMNTADTDLDFERRLQGLNDQFKSVYDSSDFAKLYDQMVRHARRSPEAFVPKVQATSGSVNHAKVKRKPKSE